MSDRAQRNRGRRANRKTKHVSGLGKGGAVKRKRPADPEAFFKLRAQRTTVAKAGDDGRMLVLAEPYRPKDFDWHVPRTYLPVNQWQPAMGITRYEFARRETPPGQVALFESMQHDYMVRQPKIAPDELWEQVMEARDRGGIMPNGLPGDDLGAVMKKIRSYVLGRYSPDGQWRLSVQAVRIGGGQVADRFDVRHTDFRTVADWTLLMRLRSWVLPDHRDAFILMPGMDVHADRWEHVYENATPNNLQLISPRSYECGCTGDEWCDKHGPGRESNGPGEGA